MIYDIKEFFQSLSLLFDFKDILNTQNEILSGIQTGLGNLQPGSITNSVSASPRELACSLRGKARSTVISIAYRGPAGPDDRTYHAQNNDPNVGVPPQWQGPLQPVHLVHSKTQGQRRRERQFLRYRGHDDPRRSQRGTHDPVPRQKLAEFVPGDDPIAAIGLVVDDFFGALYTNSGVAEATGATDNLFTTLPELFSDPNTFLQNGLARHIDFVEGHRRCVARHRERFCQVLLQDRAGAAHRYYGSGGRFVFSFFYYLLISIKPSPAKSLRS